MRQVQRSAGLWGPGAFIVAMILAARREDGYSHVRNHVSGLAAQGTRSGSVMVAGFGALGAAGLAMRVEDPIVRRVLRTASVATLIAGAAR